MADYTSDAERFLGYVGVELLFEAHNDVADLVRISGFSDPYKAIFIRRGPPVQQREVMVFLDNMRQSPTTSLHILKEMATASETHRLLFLLWKNERTL